MAWKKPSYITHIPDHCTFPSSKPEACEDVRWDIFGCDESDPAFLAFKAEAEGHGAIFAAQPGHDVLRVMRDDVEAPDMTDAEAGKLAVETGVACLEFDGAFYVLKSFMPVYK